MRGTLSRRAFLAGGVTDGISHPRQARIALFVASIDRPQTAQHSQTIINQPVPDPIS